MKYFFRDRKREVYLSTEADSKEDALEMAEEHYDNADADSDDLDFIGSEEEIIKGLLPKLSL